MNLFKDEVPRDELEESSLKNWRMIPQQRREACLAAIRPKVPAAMIEKWRDQHSRGVRIGSEYLMFHFDIGMQVRNALRAVLLDDQLPEVTYPDGKKYRNWDDFYMGALEDLVSGA